MKRGTPIATIAWLAGASGRKHYTTPHGPYYGIAKQLVLERYPAGIIDRTDDVRTLHVGVLGTMTEAEFERRRERAESLFAPDGYFDPARWKRFVQRVAKFLRFVDRGMTYQRKYEDMSDAQLEVIFQKTENIAGVWMTHARGLETELERRKRSR